MNWPFIKFCHITGVTFFCVCHTIIIEKLFKEIEAIIAKRLFREFEAKTLRDMFSLEFMFLTFTV